MKKQVLLILSIILVAGCKKPYTPDVVAAPNSYLVVEGVINSGSDSTIIKLNRTVQLSGSVNVNPELDATVTIEGDDNSSYPLLTIGKGIYVTPGLNLNDARKYRLRIRTSHGKEYTSDFVPVLKSPDIDSLTYKVESDGVSINVNTHDDKNSTRYYRWEYDETWVYTSDFQSEHKSNGDTVFRRDMINDQIYTCWRNAYSSTIVLGSSVKLSKDIINDGPITFISRHSEKIRHKYSALVRQYPLTKDAYTFWQNLKKNTEQLGSVFDAQPSQINGNIHSTSDANEPVVGYISIGTISRKRIFVDQRKLPAWLDYTTSCVLKDYMYIYNDPVSGDIVNQVDEYINFHKATKGPIIPVEGIQPPGAPKILGYKGAPPECVDCTLKGTNKQPSFWEP